MSTVSHHVINSFSGYKSTNSGGEKKNVKFEIILYNFVKKSQPTKKIDWNKSIKIDLQKHKKTQCVSSNE